jgi:hypothetical protein
LKYSTWLFALLISYIVGIITGAVDVQAESKHPDLTVVTLVIDNARPKIVGDEIRYPVSVAIMNQGDASVTGADPGPKFKIAATAIEPKGNSYRVAMKCRPWSYQFRRDDGSIDHGRVDDPWYCWSPGIGRKHVQLFHGELIFHSSKRGHDVQVKVKVDSCAGDEFKPSYCRIKESDENNNELVEQSLPGGILQIR